MIWKTFLSAAWLLVVLSVLSSGLFSVSSGRKLPINPLLTEICRYETRGTDGWGRAIVDRNLAQGLIEKVGRLRQRPVGRCQIQLATARYLGYQGTLEALFPDPINLYWAGRYLNLIERRLKAWCRGHRATLRAIAYGYPHGHNALRCNPPVGTYHDTIALAVVARRMQAFKAWGQNQRITLVRL